MTPKNPTHQLHPWRQPPATIAAAKCKEWNGQNQLVLSRGGTSWPLLLWWSIPAGLEPILDCEGCRGDSPWLVEWAPHLIPGMIPASSFLEGSLPIKYPGHGMDHSRTLSGCSRITGAMEGQL